MGIIPVLTDTYDRVKCSDVQIIRDERQRRQIDTGNLKDSIALRGVMNPIIIRHADEGEVGPYVLVAGERRLSASRELNLPTIPARFASDLSIIERRLIELEENVRREDLHWRDEVRATAEIHHLYKLITPEWSTNDTASSLGSSRSQIIKCLRIHKDIDSPKLRDSTGIEPAWNLLSRLDERKTHDAINDIIDTSHDIFNKAASLTTPLRGGEGEGNVSNPPPPPRVTTTESLLRADFLEWAPEYSGPRFNFLHCDFPYGIDAFGGPMSGRSESYGDSSDIYWELIRCLCTNLDRLLLPSAHVMFWFSMEHYADTLAAFSRLAPSLNFNVFPLIWIKSDNSGILTDSNRGPRRVYETAFMASREDRLIVKACGNAYSSPIDRKWHPSTKPEPMLRHFFSMFVDDNTMMLDPTCGSGSSIRAAESLGAKRVLGLEKDPTFYDNAASALRNFRLLNKAAEKVA